MCKMVLVLHVNMVFGNMHIEWYSKVMWHIVAC